MQWLKVQDLLPPDDQEVLLLIEGHFHSYHDPLCQRLERKIFVGSFNRKFGWHKPYVPQGPTAVIAWMPKPADLPQEKDAKDVKANGK